jgi:hypothetical protein
MFEVQITLQYPVDRPDNLIKVVESAGAYITGMETEWIVSGDSMATVVRGVVALVRHGYVLEIIDVQEEFEAEGQ